MTLPSPAPLLLSFFFLALLTTSFAFTPRTFLQLQSSSAAATNYYATDAPLLFRQTLDHFSPYDRRKFDQRYYEHLDYFRPSDGPMFLKICGESACNGISNDYLIVLAEKFGAAVVSLEHRYYGKSAPFKSHTTQNLKYLSSKQALFDLWLCCCLIYMYQEDDYNLLFIIKQLLGS